MMSQIHQNKNTEITSGSALLAGLGINPSQLLPYLAAEGRPLPAISVSGDANGTVQDPEISRARNDVESLSGNSSDPLQGWSRVVVSPNHHSSSTETIGDRRSLRASISQIDPIELARRLTPFSAETLPLSQAPPGSSRQGWAFPPGADASNSRDFGFSTTSPFDSAASRSDHGFGIGDSAPLSNSWNRTTEFSPLSGTSASPGAGDSSALEARLSRVVERLERIAEQLDQVDLSERGGPSRQFRGRADA